MIDLCYDEMTVEEIHNLMGIKSAAEADHLRRYVAELFEQRFIDWKIVEDNSVFRRQSERSCLDQEKIIHDMIELVRDIDRII